MAEALADESGLSVTGVTLESGGTLRVALEWEGEALSVALETEGM